MPEIVITQQMTDYVAFSRKQARARFWRLFLAVIAFGGLLFMLWYIGWGMVHI